MYQRIGRAGRDTDERALALIFVSKANLSGQYVPSTEKVTELDIETTARKKTKQTITAKPASSIEIQSSVFNDDVFNYTLEVSKETKPLFKKALPDIYAGPTKKVQATSASESNLVAGLHWVVQTEGCVEQPFLVAFDDPKMMERCGGCHRFRMRHLVETGTKDTPPTLYGISFTITIAYRAHIQTSTDKHRKKHKHTKQTISSDRMDKLIADIKIWRQEALNDFASRFPELTVQIIFPDKRVMTVAGKAKNIGSKEDLVGALEECGYAFPESVIFKYTEDLYRCISDSLRESHPPPQLKTQFDQAVKRAVKRRRPAESTQMVSAIGQSTHCTPSIPLLHNKFRSLTLSNPFRNTLQLSKSQTGRSHRSHQSFHQFSRCFPLKNAYLWLKNTRQTPTSSMFLFSNFPSRHTIRVALLLDSLWQNNFRQDSLHPLTL